MLFTTYTTVAAFLLAHTQGNCKVALISPEGRIVTPELLLASYPDLGPEPVATTGPDACITQGPLALHALVRHCGQLDFDFQHQQPYHPFTT